MVLGAPVDSADMDRALDTVKQCVRNASKPAYILAVNPEKVCLLRRNPSLRGFFESAALLIPNGVGLVMAARFLSGERLPRVTGADLMQRICEMAAREGFSIFLYGASQETNWLAAAELRKRYPGIMIAGRCDGYLHPDQMNDLVQRINGSGAQILFVALGSPRQEQWIERHLSRLNVRVCQGIGGTLDTIAGTTRRAPGWMRSCGLEWFYRVLRQPARAGRIATAVFGFGKAVLAAKFFSGPRPSGI